MRIALIGLVSCEFKSVRVSHAWTSNEGEQHWPCEKSSKWMCSATASCGEILSVERLPNRRSMRRFAMEVFPQCTMSVFVGCPS